MQENTVCVDTFFACARGNLIRLAQTSCWVTVLAVLLAPRVRKWHLSWGKPGALWEMSLNITSHDHPPTPQEAKQQWRPRMYLKHASVSYRGWICQAPVAEPPWPTLLSDTSLPGLTPSMADMIKLGTVVNEKTKTRDFRRERSGALLKCSFICLRYGYFILFN